MDDISNTPQVLCRCDTCSNENRGDGSDASLLRCSVCKNRFYCSAACQTQDWKEHKHSCSALSFDGLGTVQIEGCKKVIQDYVALLRAWSEQHERIKNTGGGQHKFASSRSVAARALIGFTFPENLRYKRNPPSHANYPYRSTLMLAARTGLVHLMLQLSVDERTTLAGRINAATIPATWTRLFGPKIVTRPGDLAPGEYEVFATLAPAFLLHGKRDELKPIAELSMKYKDFWVMLSEAYKALWDVPRSMVFKEM
ncbi:hypothetical protein APHAL10511_004284 [Amanita phalloides]|nr:hypothetical protein APHAL10511_004284 [Amanita phalloides]